MKKDNLTYQTDTILWERFKEGDLEALKQIYLLHFKMLYNYGKKFTGDVNIIEDCIQELFIHLMNRKEYLGKTDNLKFYLIRSLRNRLLRTFQSKYHQNTNPIFNFDDIMYPSDDNEFLNERIRKLQEALQQIGNQQREIVYLRYYNNLSNMEVAELLDIKHQTVRNSLVTALKAIRNTIR